MIYKMYCMRDKHVGFLEPRLDLDDPSAIRNFAAAVNNAPKESILGFAPQDFDLYYMGEFDTVKGTFTTVIPEFITSGSAVLGGENFEKEI